MASSFPIARVLGVAALLLLSAACSKESKPVAEDPKVPPSTEAASNVAEPESDAAKSAPAPQAADIKPATAAGAAELKSQVSEDSFDLKLQPNGSYKAGSPAQVEIVLDAKPPFKVNQEYPYSFALNESAGVKFANMKVSKDAVKLETKRATMSVPFTPSEAGERTISGTFKFSVCTEEQCLIKKEDLSLAVKVE